MAEEKGHPPSKRRREKARRQGKVTKSPILTQSICIVASLGGLTYLLGRTWVTNRMLLEYCWSEGFNEPSKCAVGMGNILLETVLPSLIFAALVSILIEGLQVGFRCDLALVSPRGSRLDFASGAARIFSGFRNSWQILLRLTVLSFVLIWFSRDLVGLATYWFVASWQEQVSSALSFLSKLLMVCAFSALSFGLLEYVTRRRFLLKELSMSSAELRQENKEDEGDPQIRAVRQALHRSMTFDELVRRTRQSRMIVVEKAE